MKRVTTCAFLLWLATVIGATLAGDKKKSDKSIFKYLSKAREYVSDKKFSKAEK